MNSRGIDGRRFQLLGRRETKPKAIRAQRLSRKRKHDPLLVLNISIFNFESGWRPIRDPVTIRESN